MPPLSGEFSLGSAGQTSGAGKANVIMFDQTKNPVFKLNEGLRTLQRKLKGNWRVLSNSGDSSVTTETLSQVRILTLREFHLSPSPLLVQSVRPLRAQGEVLGDRN